MSLKEALEMPLSFAELYYQSELWPERKKELELEFKLKEALFKRLDNLQILLSRRV